MRKSHCHTISPWLILLGLLASPSVISAPLCQPQWHNAITLQDSEIRLESGADTFLVKPSGQLYYGVHKVKLNDQQLAVLASYHRMMTDDLPYVLSHSQFIDQELCDRVARRQKKEHEIQSLIPALRQWQSVTLE
ncbi:hypothetical protein [Photobacterium kasasachensis]|uniref:hypothetical protein n=1 Tax=Photobacterium kasasachensis TaxID=2910240 RepID=UPI003D0FD4CA